jgi:glycosyltransferase involved in cell wall biosynthesis
MNLIFVGFLPPASANPEERTFVSLLSEFFTRTVVFQGIGVRGLSLTSIRSLPSRLVKKDLAIPSAGIKTGILPVLPIRRGPAGRLSAWMIRRRLTRLTKGRFPEWVFWTRFPSPELVTAIRDLPFGRVVYEAVDRYAAEPLFTAEERSRVEVAEAELCKRALVIATSAGMAKRLEGASGECYRLPIGQDSRLTAAPLPTLSKIGRPRLAVVGSLDELADEQLLVEVACERPNWQLILAGPRHRLWGQRLMKLPNVHWLGAVTANQARGVIANSDVALNPCVMNEWTQMAIPVKIFDYLAEGRPVVSTPMAELQVFNDVIEVVPRDQFVSAIERSLASDSPEAAARRRRIAGNFTTQERARRAFELITQGRELVRRPA